MSETEIAFIHFVNEATLKQEKRERERGKRERVCVCVRKAPLIKRKI